MFIPPHGVTGGFSPRPEPMSPWPLLFGVILFVLLVAAILSAF